MIDRVSENEREDDIVSPRDTAGQPPEATGPGGQGDRPFVTRRMAIGGLAGVPALAGMGAPVRAADSPNGERDESGRSGAFDAAYLDARRFGVVGNGVVDDTTAVQALLTLCSRLGRIAHFGNLQVKISGPLLISGGGLAFDTNSYGPRQPGFYPVGSGYTALTAKGRISVFRCAVIGSGGIRIDSDGNILSDTRPKVHGFQFGDPQQDFTLMISNIGYVRAYMLNGTGLRAVSVWDCSFDNISVEWCGSESDYAFSIETPGRQTTNETVFNRIQVECAVHKAMWIHGATLSCTFNKIHSERAVGKAGVLTWQLGGAGVYNSVRIHCAAGAGTALWRGDNLVVNSYRGEAVITQVNASGGTISFHEPAATFTPYPGQNGKVTVVGGAVRARNMGAGWTFLATRLLEMEVGYVQDARLLVADCCAISDFRPVQGQKASRATLRKCVVDNARFLEGETVVEGGTVFRPAAGSLSATACKVIVDGSEIMGDVEANGACLILRNGAVIEGALSVQMQAQSLCDESSYVTGRVTGWSYPRASGLLSHRKGMYCKNLSAGPGDPPAWVCTSSGTDGASGIWTAMAPLQASRS